MVYMAVFPPMIGRSAVADDRVGEGRGYLFMGFFLGVFGSIELMVISSLLNDQSPASPGNHGHHAAGWSSPADEV
jgi:hypothetical protein